MANLKKEFSKIYDRYINKIYRFIFLKVNSQEMAEDLTSETFLKTWEVFKNGAPKIENIQAFLYQTARNLVIDYYREKEKTKIISAEVGRPIADPRQNLEERVLIQSDLEKVKSAIATLNEDYQNAIIWYYLDDLPISEIAKLLGRTEEATRVLISRALKTLREKLNQKGEDNICNKKGFFSS